MSRSFSRKQERVSFVTLYSLGASEHKSDRAEYSRRKMEKDRANEIIRGMG